MKTNEMPSEEFIVWNGVGCLLAEQYVDIKLRNGSAEDYIHVKELEWDHIGDGTDIVAYRISIY